MAGDGVLRTGAIIRPGARKRGKRKRTRSVKPDRRFWNAHEPKAPRIYREIQGVLRCTARPGCTVGAR